MSLPAFRTLSRRPPGIGVADASAASEAGTDWPAAVDAAGWLVVAPLLHAASTRTTPTSDASRFGELVISAAFLRFVASVASPERSVGRRPTARTGKVARRPENGASVLARFGYREPRLDPGR